MRPRPARRPARPAARGTNSSTLEAQRDTEGLPSEPRSGTKVGPRAVFNDNISRVGIPTRPELAQDQPRPDRLGGDLHSPQLIVDEDRRSFRLEVSGPSDHLGSPFDEGGSGGRTCARITGPSRQCYGNADRDPIPPGGPGSVTRHGSPHGHRADGRIEMIGRLRNRLSQGDLEWGPSIQRRGGGFEPPRPVSRLTV